MNSVRIFLQILITTMFYNCCFCTDPAEIEYNIVLSSVDVWFEPEGTRVGKYLSVDLLKYKNPDKLFLRERDTNKSSLRSVILQDTPFDSTQLEFISMYELKLLFLLQREDKSLVYMFCQFSNKEDVQRFFDWVNPHKPKDHTIKILKMFQYPISGASSSVHNPPMMPFTNRAELSVRDITDSMNINTSTIVYYITHTSTSPNTDEKLMVDLIFVSKGFKIDAPSNDNTIALCITHAPEVGFIVKFSQASNLGKFKEEYMYDAAQSIHSCNFPLLTYGF